MNGRRRWLLPAPRRESVTIVFDYGAKADLFVARSAISRRKPLEYRSFPCASAAIRYAMEDLPPGRLGGICMEADEKRYDEDGIRNLYESEAYPLERRQHSPRGRKQASEREPVPAVPRAGE
jgi:hypothetical protein